MPVISNKTPDSLGIAIFLKWEKHRYYPDDAQAHSYSEAVGAEISIWGSGAEHQQKYSNRRQDNAKINLHVVSF